MLAGMTSRQVTEWMAFYRLEHLGDAVEFRADLRAGIVAAAVTRPHTKRPVAPEDFLPAFERPAEDPEAIRRAMVALARRQETRTAGTPRTEADGDAGPTETGGRP